MAAWGGDNVGTGGSKSVVEFLDAEFFVGSGDEKSKGRRGGATVMMR